MNDVNFYEIGLALTEKIKTDSSIAQQFNYIGFAKNVKDMSSQVTPALYVLYTGTVEFQRAAGNGFTAEQEYTIAIKNRNASSQKDAEAILVDAGEIITPIIRQFIGKKISENSLPLEISGTSRVGHGQGGDSASAYHPFTFRSKLIVRNRP